jgi:acyl-CoA reductase-like NAD-dependent aldehyde dehydrogenase
LQENIKKISFMNGNDPFIVLEDADIDRATDAAIKGRSTTKLCCLKRFIVLEK